MASFTEHKKDRPKSGGALAGLLLEVLGVLNSLSRDASTAGLTIMFIATIGGDLMAGNKL